MKITKIQEDKRSGDVDVRGNEKDEEAYKIDDGFRLKSSINIDDYNKSV